MADVLLTADLRLGNQTSFEKQIRDLERRVSQSLRVNNSQPLGRLSAKVSEFDKSLEAANARVVAFGASASVIAGVTTAIKSMVEQTIKVEKSLTDINVILGLSSSSLGKFSNELFSVAKNTGQAFDEVATAATEFSRQGLSAEDVLKRTRDAMVLTRLSGLDAAKSVSTLTATINGFSKEALDSTTIINKLATVDAKYAVSSRDLAEALSRTGSVAQDAGVNLDQLIGVITAIQQKTARGGAVIGNSLKSIFTRISRPEVLDQLEQFGIGVRDLEGNTLPAIQTLENFARSLDTVGQAQKQQLTELAGGVFQVNQLKALLGDLASSNSIAAAATRTSSQATSEATDRNEALNKTLAALTNAAQTNFAKLSAVFGKSLFGPSLERIFGQFNEFADQFDGKGAGEKIGKGLLDGIGNALSGPGLVFGAFLGAKLLTQFGKFTAQALGSLSGIGQQTQRVQDVQRGINELLSQEPVLQQAILQKSITQAEAEQRVLALIEQQIVARKAFAAASEQIAISTSAKGATFNPYSGNFKIKNKAEGHVPIRQVPAEAIAQEVEGARQAGYTISPENVRAMRTTINGAPTTVVYNSREKVISNFAGTGEPAIVPPNKSIEELANLAAGYIHMDRGGAAPFKIDKTKVGGHLGSGAFRNVYSFENDKVLSYPKSEQAVIKTYEQFYKRPLNEEEISTALRARTRENTTRAGLQQALGETGVGPKVHQVFDNGAFIAEKVNLPTLVSLRRDNTISAEEANKVLKRAKTSLGKIGFKDPDLNHGNVAYDPKTKAFKVLDLAHGHAPSIGDFVTALGKATTPENSGLARLASKNTRGATIRNLIGMQHPEISDRLLGGDLKRLLVSTPPETVKELIKNGVIRGVSPDHVDILHDLQKNSKHQNFPGGFRPFGQSKAPVDLGGFSLKQLPKSAESIDATHEFLRKNLGLSKKQVAPIKFAGLASDTFGINDSSGGAYFPQENLTRIFQETLTGGIINRQFQGDTKAALSNKQLLINSLDARISNSIVHEGFHNGFRFKPEALTRKFNLNADSSTTIPKDIEQARKFVAGRYYKGDLSKLDSTYNEHAIEEAMAIQFPRMLGFAAGGKPRRFKSFNGNRGVEVKNENGSLLKVFPDTKNKKYDIGYIESQQKGDAFKLFNGLLDRARKKGYSVNSEDLVHQEVDPKSLKGLSSVEKLYKYYPQLRYRKAKAANTTSGEYLLNPGARNSRTATFKSLSELESVVQKEKSLSFGQIYVGNLVSRPMGNLPGGIKLTKSLLKKKGLLGRAKEAIYDKAMKAALAGNAAASAVEKVKLGGVPVGKIAIEGAKHFGDDVLGMLGLMSHGHVPYMNAAVGFNLAAMSKAELNNLASQLGINDPRLKKADKGAAANIIRQSSQYRSFIKRDVKNQPGAPAAQSTPAFRPSRPFTDVVGAPRPFVPPTAYVPPVRSISTEAGRLQESLRQLERQQPSPSAGSVFRGNTGSQSIYGGPHYTGGNPTLGSLGVEEVASRNAIARLTRQKEELRLSRLARSLQPGDRLATPLLLSPERLSRINPRTGSPFSELLGRSAGDRARRDNLRRDQSVERELARANVSVNDPLTPSQLGARTPGGLSTGVNTGQVFSPRINISPEEAHTRNVLRAAGANPQRINSLIQNGARIPLPNNTNSATVPAASSSSNGGGVLPPIFARSSASAPEPHGTPAPGTPAENVKQGLGQRFLRGVGQNAFAASFVVPALGGVLSEFAKSSQTKRLIGSSTTAIGTGFGVGALIAGPAGAATGAVVGGLIAAFGTLKGIIDNLNPSLEDLQEKFVAERELREKPIQALGQIRNLNDSLDQEGLTPSQGKLILGQRRQLLSQVSGEDRTKLLNSNFSNEVIEGLVEKRTSANSTANSAASASQLLKQNSEIFAKRNGFFSRYFGQASPTGAGFSRTGGGDFESSEFTKITDAVVGAIDPEKLSNTKEFQKNFKELEGKYKVTDLGFAEKTFGALSGQGIQRSGVQINGKNVSDNAAFESIIQDYEKAGVVGARDIAQGSRSTTAGLEESERLKSLIDVLQAAGSKAIKDAAKNKELEEKVTQKLNRTIEQRIAGLQREEQAASAVARLSNRQEIAGITNQRTAQTRSAGNEFINSAISAQIAASSDTFTASSKKAIEDAIARQSIIEDASAKRTSLQANFQNQADTQRTTSLSVINDIAKNSTNFPNALREQIISTSNQSSNVGSFSDEDLARTTAGIGKAFSEEGDIKKKEVLQQTLSALRQEATTRENMTRVVNAQLSDIEKQSSTDLLILSLKKKQADAITVQTNLATQYDYQNTLKSGSRDTSSIARLGAAQVSGVQFNTRQRTGSDLRRFTRTGRQAIENERQDIVIEQGAAIQEQIAQKLLPNRDTIGSILQDKGSLLSESDYNDRRKSGDAKRLKEIFEANKGRSVEQETFDEQRKNVNLKNLPGYENIANAKNYQDYVVGQTPEGQELLRQRSGNSDSYSKYRDSVIDNSPEGKRLNQARSLLAKGFESVENRQINSDAGQYTDSFFNLYKEKNGASINPQLAARLKDEASRGNFGQVDSYISQIERSGGFNQGGRGALEQYRGQILGLKDRQLNNAAFADKEASKALGGDNNALTNGTFKSEIASVISQLTAIATNTANVKGNTTVSAPVTITVTSSANPQELVEQLTKMTQEQLEAALGRISVLENEAEATRRGYPPPPRSN